ncbi:hypothetical protein AB0K14_13370 [Actinosynnema sp. NPDC050801]|uniref:hypothetical protein n=1 Tax=unclassified Actinosynnema TaxID=2637065 RepID=UPI0033D55098
MGRPPAPALDRAFARRWREPAAHRDRRILVANLTWLVALVLALAADGSDADAPVPRGVRYLVVLATPLVLFARPRLGCAVAITSAVLLGVAGEPPSVVIPFAVNGAFCAYSLARFLIGPRRQRRTFAELAAPVAISLPDDDPVRRRAPRLRSGLIGLMLVACAAPATWAWRGDHPTTWLVVGVIGFVAAVQGARQVATRLAARRLLSGPGPAARVVVRVEPGLRLVLHTADRYPQRVAWLPFDSIDYRSADEDKPDVRAATTAITATGEGEDAGRPPSDFFPATVVGDLRVGGYVAVVTDHGVLLPDGPVRALFDEDPVEVPTGLVDGRRWSGLTRPS